MLTAERLAILLQPYVVGLELPDGIFEQCDAYLNLLLRWNARTNLTAVRDPEQLAKRQLGESLFAARCIGDRGTLLDFGSGAGFPGIPLQLARPALTVTLAESQGKKASFLREAVRQLGLGSEVWAARVEALPKERRFDVVTMRAVDQSDAMMSMALGRVREGGLLLRFEAAAGAVGKLPPGWATTLELPVPQSQGKVTCLQHVSVFHVEHGSAAAQ